MIASGNSFFIYSMRIPDFDRRIAAPNVGLKPKKDAIQSRQPKMRISSMTPRMICFTVASIGASPTSHTKNPIMIKNTIKPNKADNMAIPSFTPFYA
jgi:hypothetical protein